MEKNTKGLADAQEGEFILNESGTSVSVDPVEGVDAPAAMNQQPGDLKDKKQNDAGPKKRE